MPTVTDTYRDIHEDELDVQKRICQRAGGVFAQRKQSSDPNDKLYTVTCTTNVSAGSNAARITPPPVTELQPVMPPAAVMDTPDPVPSGNPGAFISARKTAPMTITYVDAVGHEVIREGGSRAWRNMNPGNIKKGSFSAAHGAIGDDGTFGIFPSEQIGLDAVVALLRTPSYAALTLEGAINRYAPPSENNTGAYVAFVVGKTNIPAVSKMGDLKIAQLREIAKAIRQIEGWTPGVERTNEPASGRVALVGAAATPGGISSAASSVHEWMSIAQAEAALPLRERSEWQDPGENPRILKYFKVAAAWFDPMKGDEEEWCAAFVNYCLVMSGHIGTDHPGARSFFWNKKNQFVVLTEPAWGCIAVRRYAPFNDPLWRTGNGHVGFVTAWNGNSLTLLGGNQDDQVKEKVFAKKTIVSSGSVASEFVAYLMPVMN